MEAPAGIGATTGIRASAVVRRLAACVAAGALAGLVVGGIGGRLAMLVLRLTSSPNLHGLTTDDGFTIGIVSAQTGFLLMVTTLLGATVGAGYLVVRGWLPERSRPWLAGALGALVGGARILRPEGIDFTLLDPLPLAIAMFVAIPAGVGVATTMLAERFLRDGSVFARSRLAFVSLVLLLPVVPIALSGARGPVGGSLTVAVLAIVAIVALVAVGARRGTLGRIWASKPVVWLGRVALAAAAVASSVELARDVSSIL